MTLIENADTALSEVLALDPAPDRKLSDDAVQRIIAAAGDETLGACLIAFAEGDYTRARSKARRLALEVDDDKALRRLVNTRLLYPREREWTQQSVTRSFRFYSETERQEYLRYVIGVADELRDLTPHVCLGFGSALAVARDGDFIPHDYDLDLLVAFEIDDVATLAEAGRRVRAFGQERGYTIVSSVAGKPFFGHCHLGSGGPMKPADVFYGLLEHDGTVGWSPGNRHELRREVMFPPSEAMFLGVPCPMPRDPEAYLASVYGPGWNVPDPRFTHRWSNADQYADIRGDDTPQAAKPRGSGLRRIARAVRRRWSR